jgi:hypothetical protein
MPYISEPELMTRLRTFQNSHVLPGLRTEESRERFVRKLFGSELRLRAFSMRKFSGSTDPHNTEFHPLRAIVDLFEAGQREEAYWLAFLTTQFGQEQRKTVGLFYGKFGAGKWDWDTVFDNPDQVRLWIASLPEKQLKRLKFGNHRKHETNNPKSPVGTHAVIHSFVRWADDNGQGELYKALRAVSRGKTPEDAFDQAYGALSITRFGRTAKFDFLCLLGNLEMLDISPPHCYLREGTGPKSGALLMVTGRKKGRITDDVDSIIRKLQKHLDVPVEVMEDALCNWQKRAKSARRTSELGYVTTTCG